MINHHPNSYPFEIAFTTSAQTKSDNGMHWKISIGNYRCFTDEHPLSIDLSNQVTALIGPNNSGKSAAIKLFWELGRMIGRMPSTITDSILRRESQSIINSEIRPISDVYTIFTQHNDRPIKIDLQYIPDEFTEYAELLDYDCQIYPIHLRMEIDRNSTHGIVGLVIDGQFISNIPDNFRIIQTESPTIIEFSDGRKIFYSHSAELINFDSPTFIPSNRPYGRLQIEDTFDLTMGKKLVEAWNQIKAANQPQSRRLAEDIEKELCRIFKFQNLDIFPSSDRNDLILKIDNDASHLLQDMGSGVGQFLLIIFNTVSKSNQMILFDEPEMGLHASLQIELLDLITKYANGPIIFSTHSVGLARTCANEILSFSLKDGKSIPNKFEASKNHLETLGELSFSAWREIGCNGVLFVEGPSDLKIISEWLRKLNLLKNWALISLGGSETIHSDGVEAIKHVLRVHPKVGVVIDSEKCGSDDLVEKKRTDFRKECIKIGIPCHITELRSTDNYLTDRAIKSACGAQARSLSPYEKLRNHGWGKRDGLRIAAQMTNEEIEATDIATFIRSIS